MNPKDFSCFSGLISSRSYAVFLTGKFLHLEFTAPWVYREGLYMSVVVVYMVLPVKLCSRGSDVSWWIIACRWKQSRWTRVWVSTLHRRTDVTDVVLISQRLSTLTWTSTPSTPPRSVSSITNDENFH